MLNQIHELFRSPRTKAGARTTPAYTEQVKASARFGDVTRPETLLNVTTTGRIWGYNPTVEVGRLYPIISVNVHIPGTGQDTRWFLRQPDAIAYVVQLRLEYSNMQGVETALEKLSPC